jgi:HSP20 family protein
MKGEMIMALVPISRRTRDLANIPDRWEDIFGRFLAPFEGEMFGGGWFPSLDIAEKGEAIVVKAELPGMKADEIELSVDGNMLTVSGEKKDETKETKDNYYHVERRYGKFQRTIQLPSEVDKSKIEAKMEDGVLTVTLPRSEEAKPRKIQVK